jgi:biopolymer transport protein ExbB
MLRLILANGGLILIPLALTSLVALWVAIERLWRLLPLRRRFAAERAAWHERLLRDGAMASAAHAAPGAIGRIIVAGLKLRARGPELVRLAALDAAQREVTALERGLGVLIGAVQIAPLLGLLGTVTGLIQAFEAASTGEQISAQLLSAGIYKALTTTVAGLLVAIPAYLAYSALGGVVARLADDLEHTASELPLLVGGLRE